MKKLVKIFLCAVMATVMLSVTAFATTQWKFHYVGDKEEQTISVGESYDLFADLIIIELYDEREYVFWSSSNEDIVSVNADGIMTGLAQGEAVIEARNFDKPNNPVNLTVYVE